MSALNASIDPLPDVSYDVRKARIEQLFETSEGKETAETYIEAIVSRLSRDFVRATSISTDVDLRLLRERFKASSIQVEPADAGSYIEYLAANVVSHAQNTSSPRFIGHMTSSLPYFAQHIGRLMIAMNQNVVKMETSKVLSYLERQALAMMHRLIFNFSDEFYDRHVQRSESTLGMITSGGTLANLTALWCARNSSLGPAGNFGGIETEGLSAALDYYGYKEAVIIGSSLMHYSFDKAAGILGIGTRNLIRIPIDQDHRIDLRELRKTVAKAQDKKQHVIALVGIAGTTDSGAVDPLEEIAEIAHEANIHFHVDAAWGGPVLFSSNSRNKLTGIEQADSVLIDGHKQMYLPMGIGMVLLRNPHIAKVIEKEARYIVRPGSADLGRRSLEGSRPAKALFLHAALNIIGQKGYEVLIDEGIRKAQYMADAICARPEFELLVEPQINILTYRYVPRHYRERAARRELGAEDHRTINDFNERLQKAQRHCGRSFVSRTTLDTTAYGRGLMIRALRAVLANPLTTENDIDAVLDEQVEIASKLSVA